MKKIFTYLLHGLFFLLVMEFMFKIQIQNKPGDFFFVLIIELPFLLLAYFTSKRVFKNSRKRELWIYLIYGLIGLIFIEWIFVGNTPFVLPNLLYQFMMFSYWGGAVVFSRILTDKNDSVKKIRTWTLRYFVIYSIIAITFGFLVPSGTLEQRMIPILLMAIAGYGLMNIFYIWYFVKSSKK
jgi:hypothetical protein